jgi:hypothetical protein
MKVSVGTLFVALQIVEHEVGQIAKAMPAGAPTEEYRRISAIHAILHRELKGCPTEVETLQLLDHLLVPFFENYGLEIISKKTSGRFSGKTRLNRQNHKITKWSRKK